VPSPEPPIDDDPVRAAFRDALQAMPEPADLDLRADLGAVVGRARSRRRRRRGLTVVAAATAVALLAGGVALAASVGDDGGTSEVLAGDGDTTPEPATVPSPRCLVPPAEAVGVDDGSLRLLLEAGPDVAPGSVIPFRLEGDLGDATVDLGTAVVEWWDGTRWAHAHEVVDLFDAEQPAGLEGRAYPSFGAITAAIGPLAWYRLTLPVVWNDVTQGDGMQTSGGLDLQAFWSVGCTPGNAPDPDANAQVVGCDLPAISVFLEPGVDAARVEAVRDALRALEQDGVVSSVTYLDAQASYMEFQRRFADSPDILAGIGPDDVPTSFVAEVVIAEADRVHAAVEGLPGVAQVLDAFDPMTCGTSWWLGSPETCVELLATTTTTTVPTDRIEHVSCAELVPTEPTTTTVPGETCVDLLATTTSTPPEAGYAIVVDCVEFEPADPSTTTTASAAGPAGPPEPGCPEVDLEARSVRGLVGRGAIEVEISWSLDQPEAGVVIALRVEGDLGPRGGYDRDRIAESGYVAISGGPDPDILVGVVADGRALLPPGQTVDDGRRWEPELLTDPIEGLGGRVFAARVSEHLLATVPGDYAALGARCLG
jgi:hypothetical protein